MKMLFRFLLYISILIFTISQLSAQEDVLRPEGKPGGYDYEYAYAQPGITFGGEVGLNYNMFSSDMSWSPPLANSPLQAYSEGWGLSPYFAVLIDVPISPKYGFQFKIAGDSKYFSNSHVGVADCYDEFTQEVYDMDEELEYSISGSYLGASLLFRANFTPQFFLLAGPVLQIPIGDFTQDVTIRVLNSDCVLDNGEQTDIINAPVDELNTRVGLEAGIGYKIPIARQVWMVPQLRLQYMFTTFTPDEMSVDITRSYSIGPVDMLLANQMLHSLHLSVGFWFDI
ncbi:MAG: outer membrane beta-barrel protein [Candidatus Kapaibacterium sp.]